MYGIFSLGFILKIFLKFCKFQPQYSYKVYSYIKKSVVMNFEFMMCCQMLVINNTTSPVSVPKMYVKNLESEDKIGWSNWCIL